MPVIKSSVLSGSEAKKQEDALRKKTNIALNQADRIYIYIVTSPSSGVTVELCFLNLSLGDYKRVCLCLSGCGGYADNKVGAVSTTGHGEAIMKVTLARLILFHMEQGNTHHVHSHTVPPAEQDLVTVGLHFCRSVG